MKVSKIWDSADGAATPGRVFTASIQQESIPSQGTRLDYLTMGVKGAISTAAVVIETFAGLVAPFTLRRGSENRIVLNLDELCALMAFYFGELPTIGENTDATGNNFIGGLKIPVYDSVDVNAPFLVQADRVAQTNVATETLALTGYFDTGAEARKPIQAVRLAHTTAGSAGLEQIGIPFPGTGRLIGLIVKQPNGFADGNIDVSVQKIKIYEDTQLVAEVNALADARQIAEVDYVTPSPMADLMRQFQIFDFRPLGLDVKAKRHTFAVDVQDVSDACVFIPVIEMQ